MDAATWRWAKELLADALKLPEPDRAGFLRDRCANEDVRSEIQSLLRRYDAPDSLDESTAARPALSFDELHFSPGRMFAGRYRIVGFLGRGGMGEVYRAEDVKLDQQVALKFLPASFANDRQRLARFMAEVRIARTVTHPNVCRVFDVGEDEGLHYLSMEYIDGDDLASLLRRVDRFHPEKGTAIARQLCAGLAAAHERGVLHRDLKPANVLIDGRGQAHIVDFGLAVAADAGTTKEIAGTPAYMAPEQFSGGPLTAQTDIFSLGLVIYELFAGRRFSHARGVGDTAAPAIVTQCLSQDPSDRPASASVVGAALSTGSSAPIEAAAAAATQEGSLSPPIASLALASIVAGAIAVTSLSHVATFRASDVPNSPEVLGARARSVLADAGFAAGRRDSESSFVIGGGLQPIRFLYRESQSYLSPSNLFRLVTDDDPPEDVAGMATVLLDPGGRLVRFSGIPSAAASEAVPGSASWRTLFADAALDERDFVRTEAAAAIPTPHDSAISWRRGNEPDAQQVIAATDKGRVVFFEVKDGSVPVPARRNVLISRRPPAAEAVFWGLIAVAFAAGVVLARRAIVSGQVDRVVPRRMAGFIACAGAAFALMRAHHVPIAVEEATLVLGLSGWVLIWTAFTWLTYVGMEPYLRRKWPRMLLSFARLVRGRVRDPLVGRDVLVGLLAALALAGIGLTSLRLGHRPPPEVLVHTALQGLRSSRHFIAMLLFHMTDTLQFALGGILFLLLLRLIVRSAWVATALWVALIAPASTATPLLSAPFSIGVSLALVLGGLFALFIVLRFGLLAGVVMLLGDRLLTQMPVTLDVDSWYFGASLATLLLLLGLAFYGFIVALGGRPVLADAASAPLA